MSGFGRPLIVLGLVIVAFGLALSFGDRFPVRLDRLPGDMMWRGKNSTFYFPLVTSIVLSVILSVVMWVIGRIR